MEVTFDPSKRAATLQHRGLDFADAGAVLAGVTVEYEDDRFDYGEMRNVSVGMLRGQVVVVVWADRAGVPHVISMRKATKGEADEYYERVG